MTYTAIVGWDFDVGADENWVFLELESALQRIASTSQREFSETHRLMKPSAQFKQSRKPSGLLIPLILACFALSKNAQGVVPPPDGGYPNFTTAEGTKALFSLTTGSANTAVGWFSLFSNAGGSFNTAAGAGTLLFNTGDSNTAFGTAALLFNTTGFQNTAVGTAALLNNTTGNGNTAAGINALNTNTEGNFNTAIGGAALVNNTNGAGNTATGALALNANTTGGLNTATGFAALQNNTGTNNTAMGAETLGSNTAGGGNTATGVSALGDNTVGGSNTAIGADALSSNATGNGNTASGVSALLSNTDGDFNTAIGLNALNINATGNNNIAFGFSAGSNITGDNNIDIGSTGGGGEFGTIRIGQSGSQTTTFIAGIRGVTTANMNAISVVIDSEGQLGTVSSSRRFKREIKPMNGTSESILALNPVTFHYKSDNTHTAQFGLIAEEVAAVNPDLVVHDENGEIYTVRYDAVNAMLLNEFLKEHRKVEALTKDFQLTIAQLTARLDEQAAQIEKVSAQLGAGKTMPQVVNNP
jgi:Chaperone of endosialidase